MQRTLKQLRHSARERADLTRDSDSVNDQLANEFVNEAWHELYDLITCSDDARLFARNAKSLPKVGDYSYQLPYDFYRLVSLHVFIEDDYVPAQAADSGKYPEMADEGANLAGRPQYYIRWDVNTGERFAYVFPNTTNPVAVVYFQQPKDLTIDTDSLDSPASWLEFVVVTAAIKMLTKLERDTAVLMYCKQELAVRIENAVTNMDFMGPRRIRDLGGYDV